MRFEIAAAFVVGVLLPALETIRRGIGYWAIDATTMMEDYLAGALLLVAGLAARRGAAYSGPLLLTAWAGVSSMMMISLISQIEDTIRAVEIEPHNTVVLSFKLILCATCLTGLIRSFRAVRDALVRSADHSR
jgi:hypothetical protein